MTIAMTKSIFLISFYFFVYQFFGNLAIEAFIILMVLLSVENTEFNPRASWGELLQI